MSQHYIEVFTDNGEIKDAYTEYTRADGTVVRLPEVDLTGKEPIRYHIRGERRIGRDMAFGVKERIEE